MVAKTSIADRFVSPPDGLLSGRWRPVRFTRRDAEALVRIGIIPEDASTELLNGIVVLKDRAATGEDPTMIGQAHRVCVERLSALRKLIDNPTRHVESQQPLVCSDIHVPEPDFMVVRGAIEDYSDLPTAADAFCVVEVADASYERDITDKLAGYARAGVAQYIVINLRTRTAEIYTSPSTNAGTYAPPQVLTVDQTVSLRVGTEECVTVALRAVLP